MMRTNRSLIRGGLRMKKWMTRSAAAGVIAAAGALVAIRSAQAGCNQAGNFSQGSGAAINCYIHGEGIAQYQFWKVVDAFSSTSSFGRSHAQGVNGTSVSSSALGRVQCSKFGSTAGEQRVWSG